MHSLSARTNINDPMLLSDINQETRASAQSGCLGARVRLPTQWGISLFAKSIRKPKGGHHLVFQLQGISLMHGLNSRMRNGILTIRNDVSLHKVHLALR